MLIPQNIRIEIKPEMILHRDMQQAAHERVQDSINQMRHRNDLIKRGNTELFEQGAFNYGAPRDMKIGATVILPNVVQIVSIRERNEYLEIEYVQEIP